VPKRLLVSRIWYISTMLYLAACVGAAGYASDWTFKGSASPLGELLAAPIFFSFGGFGIYIGTVSWAGSEIDRTKHPISFWFTTISIFSLGVLFLTAGLRGLYQ
jgi:hypothetical protein